MGRTLHVYVGPCLKVWKKPTETDTEFYAQIDEFLKDTYTSFKRVLSGDMGYNVFLIPDLDENRPQRVCEWDKNDSLEPITERNFDIQREMSQLYTYIAGFCWPKFSYLLTWGVVPYMD